MADSASAWLVKSSGRILGPFPEARIAELLRTREISVLDEVSQPLRRWQTIQYHAQFREVVENLRRASLSEKTEATWTPGGGLTGITQTLTDLQEADLTEDITMDLDSFSGSNGKEIVIHNVKEQNLVSGPVSAARFQTQLGQTSAIQQQVERTTKGLWIVTIVVLVSVFGYILHRRYSAGPYEGKLPVQNLRQNVLNLVQVGQYQEALRELKNYYPDPTLAGDLSIYYGSLLIQVEGQTVMGRRLLQAHLQAKRPEVKQAYTGLGVADLLDGQLESAEANFDKALAVDSDYVPSIINLAAVALQKGDFKRAKNLASRALTLSPFQGEAMLILSEAQLYISKAANSLSELVPISRMIQDFQTRQWDYFAEVGFYSLYFDYLRKDKALEAKINRYLDGDPRLTTDHRHNVFIYKGRTSWKILGRLCEQMRERMNETARVAVFQASCYAREGRWDAARQFVEKAVHQSPKDPLVQAWYSYVLKESGDADQASVIFAKATEYNRRGEYILPTLLQARFSQANEDVEGARVSWQRLYERDLNYLPAVAGLAWVHVKSRSFNEASKMIHKGLQISPDYIPLLQLRQKGETEGWYVVASR